MTDQPVLNTTRLKSVDAYRGFAIMSMIIVNFLAFYNNTPHFLKHAKGNFITFADIVAPMFLFVLGIMYRKSIKGKFENQGRIKTYLLFGKRYTLILFIGLFGGSVSKMSLSLDWGILQAIGLAGLIALPFMELTFRWRVLTGLSFALIHQLVIIPFAKDIIAAAEHGGPLATLAWTSIIILSSLAGDHLKINNIFKSIKMIAIIGASLILIGLIFLNFYPINKLIITSSYITICTGLSAIIFIIFIIITDKINIMIPSLDVLGRNALLIFLFHYLIIKVVHKLTVRTIDLPILIFLTLTVYCICFLFAWVLDKKKIYLKL